jgi:hypothetical protein
LKKGVCKLSLGYNLYIDGTQGKKQGAPYWASSNADDEETSASKFEFKNRPDLNFEF